MLREIHGPPRSSEVSPSAEGREAENLLGKSWFQFVFLSPQLFSIYFY
jgi:hypothetical protein